MAYDKNLAERIRTALADHPAVREVKMFGGLSFMVDDRLTVGANAYGDLMVRVDPSRADELVAQPGARHGEMKGRSMSKGWLFVDAAELADEKRLRFWIATALEHNEKATRSDR